MLTTVTKKNISAIIDGALHVEYSATGNPVVQVGPSGAKVVSYTPAFDPVNMRNGNMLNVPGSNTTPISTFNSIGASNVAHAGDVLMIVRDAANPNLRTSNWPRQGDQSRSRVDEAMSISFVSYKPVAGQLTPPVIGRRTNPIISFLRGTPITDANIRAGVARLPKLVDLSRFDNDLPGFELLESVFSDTWADAYDGWSTDTNTPALQHPGYGRDVASWVSKMLLYAVSTESDEAKFKLVRNAVDQGLSLAAAFGDGRVNQANGGHMAGRKALVVFAGYVLGVAPMANPNWLGFIFQEDHMHRFEQGKHWWFSSSWTSLWRRASEFRHPCDTHPSTWTSNEVWAINGYYQPQCGANIGTAIAMHAMGLQEAIGIPFMQGIMQYMEGPPDSADAALKAKGVNIPWGLDWPSPWNGVGFQKKAWELYGYTSNNLLTS